MQKNHERECMELVASALCATLLEATRPYVERARDERELGCAQTITDEQYRELLEFRMSLRDIEKHRFFPAYNCIPNAPKFLGFAVPNRDEFNGEVYQRAFRLLQNDAYNASRQQATPA